MPARRAPERNHIRRILEIHGMTVADLADRAGASTVHTSKVANGSATPSERFKRLVALVLGVPVEVVFPRTPWTAAPGSLTDDEKGETTS